MRKFTVEVPDELNDLAGNESSASHWLTQTAVMELVRRRRISTGKAAELLGMNRWDLPDVFQLHQVASAELSPDDLQPF